MAGGGGDSTADEQFETHALSSSARGSDDHAGGGCTCSRASIQMQDLDFFKTAVLSSCALQVVVVVVL